MTTMNKGEEWGAKTAKTPLINESESLDNIALKT